MTKILDEFLFVFMFSRRWFYREFSRKFFGNSIEARLLSVRAMLLAHLRVCAMFSIMLPGFMSPRFGFLLALAFLALFRRAWNTLIQTAGFEVNQGT